MSARVALIAALAFATASLWGCGEAADRPPDPGSAANPVVGELTQDSAAARAEGGGEPTADAPPGYAQLVDGQTGRSQRRFSPCNLVSRGQARVIVGGSVDAPVEAPQGPTCLYRGDGVFVSVAVQRADATQLRREIRRPRTVRVGGHEAYCGERGGPTLLVPLARGRVLSVGAPCALARGFADRALARLAG